MWNYIIDNIWIGDIEDAKSDVDKFDVIFDVREQLKFSPTEDVDASNLVSVAGAIDWCLRSALTVGVHCTEGIERAPLAVATYLVEHQGYTYEKAYRLIKKKRTAIAVKDCRHLISDRKLKLK